MTRYSEVTPKRPDATCLIAERRRSPFGVADVAVGVFAALAGVRLAADAVHRDGEVSCASFEIEPYDIAPVAKRFTISRDRLDLVDRHRLAAHALGVNANSPRSVASLRRLVVDELRVLLVDVVALGAGRVLQLEHGLGVEEVVLALAAPLVLAAEVEVAVRALVGAVGYATR